LRKVLFIAILFLFSTICFSQGFLDTIRRKIENAPNDSVKIEIYYLGAFNKKLVSKTTDSLREVLKKFTKSPSCRTKWFAYLRLAMYEDFKDMDGVAVEHFLQVLDIAEKCGDKYGMGLINNRLGAVNLELFNYKAAINFFHQSLTYAKYCNDEVTMAEDYGFLGSCFKDMKGNHLDSSLFYTMKALPLREKQKDKKKIANVLNSIGLIYKMKKDLPRGVEYLQKALAVRREVNDKRGVAGACINIANCLRDLGRLKEGLALAHEGTDLANKLKEGEYFRNGLSSQAELYYKMKDFEMASYYFRRQRNVNDSIKLDAMDRNILELEERFESNKKDHELKNKENAIRLGEAENSRKNVLIVFSVIALIMTLVAIIFIYRSYRINKKSAIDLSRKNKLIEEKNKEITDSINYAKNIQHSLLSSEKLFKENSSDHFILFKPKDIVSGDFYWARKMNDGFLVMCADCTGHGVPGAFMSLLGITHIKEITNTGISAPDQILNELRKALIDIFSLNDSKDGMDAALVKISGNKLQMSAANNPIWVIRDKISVHIKPNKFPIGKHYGEMGDFTLNEIPLQKNDLIVMFTDGYADQFGGPKNKKYKYKKMEEFIIANCDSDLSELKSKLEVELKEWRGKNEQIDDVLVIGIKI
jgi:serine phosphatase RsbU (regulator of sigma subunit)